MKASKISVRLAALLVAGSAVMPASASDYEGYVTSLVQIGTRVYVYIGGDWFGADQCGSGRTQLILYTDTGTADGRSFIALATSAKLTGTQVYASGTGACYTGGTPNGATSEPLGVLWLQ